MGNVIQDLAAGAAQGLFSGIGEMAKDIRTAITGIDPAKQALIEQKLLELEAKAMDANAAAQEIVEKDRESARTREVELAKAGKTDWLPPILAVIAVLAFCWCLYTLFFNAIDAGAARDLLMSLIGALTMIVKDLYGYYFGSSSGSADKTAALADVMKSMIKK